VERPPPGGITWTISGERLAVLAWPRAILLQVAHPLVAAGVNQHSGFRASPVAAYERLHATIGAMRQLVFGTEDQAAATVRRILSVHDRVNGTLQHGAGRHAGGTRYTAHDPALLLWVHATLLDSHVRILEAVLRPFTADERDRYCRETASFAELLGAVPDDMPRTWADLQAFMTAQIEGGQLAVGADARALAPAILQPPFSRLVWPFRYAGELVTVGSLPPAIREGFGFAWDAARERHRQRAVAALRAIRSVTPDLLARWPEARHVRRAE
jgi:uncharacterized protein (DUF2236 family)